MKCCTSVNQDTILLHTQTPHVNKLPRELAVYTGASIWCVLSVSDYCFDCCLHSPQATLSDKAAGSVLILVALLIFTYYTFWVLVLPFVDPAHFLHGYFLPRWYAVALPIGAGVLLLGFVGVFVAIVMIQDSAKKRAKAKKSE